MLLEAIKGAGINNTKEDDSYLALVQDGHVRIAILLITVSRVDILFSKSRFSGSLPETQAGVQYPSSRMRRRPRGPWCRYGVDSHAGTSIDVFRTAVLSRVARAWGCAPSSQAGNSILLPPSAARRLAGPDQNCRGRCERVRRRE